MFAMPQRLSPQLQGCWSQLVCLLFLSAPLPAEQHRDQEQARAQHEEIREDTEVDVGRGNGGEVVGDRKGGVGCQCYRFTVAGRRSLAAELPRCRVVLVGLGNR